MTWTIEMNAKELACKAEIERVEEKRTSQKEAATRLGVSERLFRRILRRYRLEGVAGLVFKKRGVPSNRKMEAVAAVGRRTKSDGRSLAQPMSLAAK